MALRPVTGVTGKEKGKQGKEGRVKMGQGLERCSHKPRNARGGRQPPGPGREAWDGFSLRAPRRNPPADTLLSVFWPPGL